MKAHRIFRVAAVGFLSLFALAPGAALAAPGLAVDVWTQRGADAVYPPGSRMEVSVRASADAYVIVYDIDAEGRVRLLYPYRGGSGFIEGRRSLRLPAADSQLELVVHEPVGQGYIVAVASLEPFVDLPWYLRPYDPMAESVGYTGDFDEGEGVTAEGRVIGDPFVAMERIRRRVLPPAAHEDGFATAFAGYYVGRVVRHPRYLCYDCHRPHRWAWWPGFDPYVAHCSVFDFRVNWGWHWGPAYWYGYVPYYYFVYRHDCPPRYRPYYLRSARHSSWDGWSSWSSWWGDRLTRYKPDARGDREPRTRYREPRAGDPPGPDRRPAARPPTWRQPPPDPGERGGRGFEERRPRDRGTGAATLGTMAPGRAAPRGPAIAPGADRGAPGRGAERVRAPGRRERPSPAVEAPERESRAPRQAWRDGRPRGKEGDAGQEVRRVPRGERGAHGRLESRRGGERGEKGRGDPGGARRERRPARSD